MCIVTENEWFPVKGSGSVDLRGHTKIKGKKWKIRFLGYVNHVFFRTLDFSL